LTPRAVPPSDPYATVLCEHTGQRRRTSDGYGSGDLEDGDELNLGARSNGQVTLVNPPSSLRKRLDRTKTTAVVAILVGWVSVAPEELFQCRRTTCRPCATGPPIPRRERPTRTQPSPPSREACPSTRTSSEE
jgi:hypothetical protein